MSTAEILSLVSLISYILAGVFLALTVLFWFVFKIPTVVGDLSGRTAKKSIEKMRQANARTGNKSYRSSPVNKERGMLTSDAIRPAPQKPVTPPAVDSQPATTVLTENRADSYAGEQTVYLGDDTATCQLDDGTTTMLDNETESLEASVTRTGGKKLTMLNDIVLIHTDEVIL